MVYYFFSTWKSMDKHHWHKQSRNEPLFPSSKSPSTIILVWWEIFFDFHASDFKHKQEPLSSVALMNSMMVHDGI